MYQLVLCLLLLLSLNKHSVFAIPKEIAQKTKNTKEELPIVIYICEYCGQKQEKMSAELSQKLNDIEPLENFKYIYSQNWATESKLILKKQQDTEYQILGSKSWPPKIPFALFPITTTKGLLVFKNYINTKQDLENTRPLLTKYVLFYQERVIVAESIKEIQSSLDTATAHLNKRDGLRFYISKEITGEKIKELEKVIKNFTADKNSIMIPYQVTQEGVRYHSDIDISNKMRTIKQINQFVPNLSAQSPHGTIDIIEITSVK